MAVLLLLQLSSPTSSPTAPLSPALRSLTGLDPDTPPSESDLHHICADFIICVTWLHNLKLWDSHALAPQLEELGGAADRSWRRRRRTQSYLCCAAAPSLSPVRTKPSREDWAEVTN